MPKVHELLAVQGNINGQTQKLRTDLMATFEKKKHLFQETLQTFQSTEEGKDSTPQVESQQSIQTSVLKEINWISQKLVKMIDIGHQVDIGNTQAKADVTLEDGTTLLRDIPATTLLWLEKRISEWKDLILSIPTLDPAKGFSLDTSRGKGIYKAREVNKPRTRKTKEVIQLSPATDKHPAQVQLIDIDKNIGTIKEQEWSSMITPALKADLLDNVEKLDRAVKAARSKANEQEVAKDAGKIGSDLLEFIFKPLQGEDKPTAFDAA
jgi:hypothetical protein